MNDVFNDLVDEVVSGDEALAQAAATERTGKSWADRDKTSWDLMIDDWDGDIGAMSPDFRDFQSGCQYEMEQSARAALLQDFATLNDSAASEDVLRFIGPDDTTGLAPLLRNEDGWQNKLPPHSQAWAERTRFQAAADYLSHVYDRYPTEFRSPVANERLGLAWQYGDDPAELVAQQIIGQPQTAVVSMPPRSTSPTVAPLKSRLCGHRTQDGSACGKPIAAGKTACHFHG